ncbi:inactive 2'-5'-oligoadenylate synthase 1D-like [Arvicanthis niloticus]|uniref:inactive 2'-5'-oligoadenylate synthase 1D-like n=1 Tax=Arvicanthis niloticus TaxID=61156 RepID=UPI00148701B7|nr:inactive 2'-5'-oligoadenylate synthase 1D-like [Arvicanthis niloticus]
MEEDLSSTAACELDKYIEDHLLPDTTFLTGVRADIDFISAFLKERCFQGAAHPVRVSRVVMGGSYDEHTALKGRSEANMVVLFNNLTSFEDQLNWHGEFLEEIQKHLCQLQQEKQFKVKFEFQSSERPNSRSLSFKLNSPELQQEMEFDVHPAYDALYELRNYKHLGWDVYNIIYAQLISECTALNKEGEFSMCFIDLQQKFLRDQPPELWNVIRMVKHWYQLCKEKLRKPLPPVYALELLTVYAWECGVKDRSGLHVAQCFRSVLDLITDYLSLLVYWRWCCEFKHEISDYLNRQLQKDRPVILDPADPTWNVAGSNKQAWHLLANEAMIWTQLIFFVNSDMSLLSG